MATYNRKDRRLIEDWGGVNTAVVIPDGQFRWYDGVTGYNAAEVIELVGDGATTIASLPKRQPATDGAQTLYGVKTFNAIPVLPSTAPSSDNQAMSKVHAEALLGLPAGYIYGLETEADTDTDHDVIINVGKCRDYDDTVDIEVETLFTKRIDATFAAGDDAGGMFTGAVAADATYHLFVIVKDSDSSIDGGWDTDIDCANIPTGYTEYRRIRSHRTDSSSNILDTTQQVDNFRLKEWILDIDGASITTTAANFALSIPSDLSLFAMFISRCTEATAATVYWYSPNDTDQSVSAQANTSPASTRNESVTASLVILSNTSSEIRGRASGTTTAHYGYTRGWIDDRGQHGGK